MKKNITNHKEKISKAKIKERVATAALKVFSILFFLGLILIAAEILKQRNNAEQFCIEKKWDGANNKDELGELCWRCYKRIPHKSGLGIGEKTYSGCIDNEIKNEEGT